MPDNSTLHYTIGQLEHCLEGFDDKAAAAKAAYQQGHTMGIPANKAGTQRLG